MIVELVDIDRVRPQQRLNMPSIRVVRAQARHKQRQGRRHQVTPPTMKGESSNTSTRNPSQSVKRGKAFFKKQSRYKPTSVWYPKENNAADLRTSTCNKGTYESVSEEESVPAKAKMAFFNIDLPFYDQENRFLQPNPQPIKMRTSFNSLPVLTNATSKQLWINKTSIMIALLQTINQQWHHHTISSWNAPS